MEYATKKSLLKTLVKLHKHFISKTDSKSLDRLDSIKEYCLRNLDKKDYGQSDTTRINAVVIESFSNKKFSSINLLYDRCCDYIHASTNNRSNLKHTLAVALDKIECVAEKNILLTPHFRHVALSKVNTLHKHIRSPYRAINAIIDGKRSYITLRTENKLKNLTLDFIQICVNTSTWL